MHHQTYWRLLQEYEDAQNALGHLGCSKESDCENRSNPFGEEQDGGGRAKTGESTERDAEASKISPCHSPENRGMPFRRAKGHIECPRFEIAVRELVTLRIMAGNASFSTLEPHVTHRTPTDIHIDVRAVMAAEDYSCRSDLGKNSAGQPVKIIPSLLRCVK